MKSVYNEEYEINEEEKLIIPPEGFSLEQELMRYEKQLILNSIAASGNLVKAAKRLGISKQALNYKIKKYNIK